MARTVKTNRHPFVEVILSDILDNSVEGENAWLVQDTAMISVRLGQSYQKDHPASLVP